MERLPSDERSNDRELFDVFSAEHELLGQEERLVVHTRGLYHQSVHVLVFKGQEHGPERFLLLQKRADSKRIAPGLWDLSCAEHNQPGESFDAAAKRGLKEELGLECYQDFRLVRQMQLFQQSYPEAGYTDNEFVACYAVHVTDDVAERIVADPGEVAETKWMRVSQVLQEMEHRPKMFTPWFLKEQKVLRRLD